MTKQETYDELVKRGATLKPVASYKADELKALLADTPEPGAKGADDSESGRTDSGNDTQGDPQNKPDTGDAGNDGAAHQDDPPNVPADPVPPADPVKEEPKKFPVLRFPGSGWCNEIGYSYTKGLYRPKSAREYEALRKYAVEEIAQ